MRRKLTLGTGLLLATSLSSLAASAAENGRVKASVRWADGDASTCRFGVQGESATRPVSSMLELEPGAYRILVRCGDDPELVPPAQVVKVRAGKVSAPRFDVARAKVRVMTRRGGTMQAGEVRFFEVGRALEGDPPASEHATNVTAKLSAGRYDVLVRMSSSEPAAEALLERVRLKPGRNKDIVVDLSDGSLIARAKENRKRASGAVRVFLPDTEQRVAVGDTEQELRLPAGRYDVTVELRSAANFATQTKSVWVRAGKTTKVDAKFATGKLQVKVTRDRKPVDATVQLSLPLAADFFNFFEAPGPAVLTPGAYNVTVASDAAKALGTIRREGVKIRGRKTTKLTIDISQATLQVNVTKNGKPTTAIVEVREPGGGAVIARVAKASARLWPGRYELRAQLPDGAEKVDGPFEVALGQKLTRTIRFELASLRVDALRGPAPEVDARVLVYRPGAAKPLAKGRHGEALELSAGTYDIKVVAGPDTAWKQGVVVEGAVKVQVGLPELVDADPLPAGEAPDEEFELPAGDADE